MIYWLRSAGYLVESLAKRDNSCVVGCLLFRVGALLVLGRWVGVATALQNVGHDNLKLIAAFVPVVNELYHRTESRELQRYPSFLQ